LALTAFTRLALAQYQAAGLVAVAVLQDNIASWRALEKAGYRRCWAGELASDEGPMYLYRRDRSVRFSITRKILQVLTWRIFRVKSILAAPGTGVTGAAPPG